jgi:hypothetical protein
MAIERRYMNRINGWAQLAAGVNANPQEAEHLQPGTVKLQGLHTRAIELSKQQAALTTAKQEVTKQLRQVLREGDSLADFIRTGARAYFGKESEKMFEFGMQPFRGLKNPSETKERKPRARKPAAPETSAPAIETPTPDTVK